MAAFGKAGAAITLALATTGLGACTVVAPVPPQVPYVAIPGPAKTDVQFHQDDTTCRAASVLLPVAEPVAGAAAGVQAEPPGVAYLRCMALRNNVIQPLATVAPPLYAYYPAYPVYQRYGDYYPWLYGGYGYGGLGYAGFYGGGWRGYGGYGFREGGFREGGFRDGGFRGGGGEFRGGGGRR